ncbi:cytochrome P450 [Solwaraspora sp. WMMD1047]|uniref:cytochrome P450 n=1 Tax=Solwaraspora sp. WMMD1047 TaxID=3016102 RepID=UPI0024180612|nr:cytochrome P450 [Solwaraspora sp. WMMD1047]MDG4831704.1 cytochrome P450 [Solwaraspora sp. WMMD1047]
MMANWLVMIDPPRHTALREVHDQVFTADLMASARPVSEKLIAELLADGVAAGGMDLVGQFADKLPVYVINHLLGLPRADWDQFVAWSRALAATTEPLLTSKVLRAGQEAVQGMSDYLRPLAAQRAQAPGDDVLSGLATAEANGVRLSEEELLDSVVFLYQAAHPTGTGLIALGALALLRNPDQLALLRADPTLLAGAVEELHRYDAPAQMNDRVATEDMELFGVPLRRGQLVRLCLASANRDPAWHPDAERLDVTRPNPRHFGFGHGLHYCVAAAVGRMQSQAAFGALLDSAPNLRLTDAKLRFMPSASNRGLIALPVEF